MAGRGVMLWIGRFYYYVTCTLVCIAVLNETFCKFTQNSQMLVIKIFL